MFIVFHGQVSSARPVLHLPRSWEIRHLETISWEKSENTLCLIVYKDCWCFWACQSGRKASIWRPAVVRRQVQSAFLWVWGGRQEAVHHLGLNCVHFNSSGIHHSSKTCRFSWVQPWLQHLGNAGNAWERPQNVKHHHQQICINSLL